MQGRNLHVSSVSCTFLKQELLNPIGFKGAYLTGLWQTAVTLRSSDGVTGRAVGTQSVLYTDPELFDQLAEDEGNLLMFRLTSHLCDKLQDVSVSDPIEAFSIILNTGLPADLTNQIKLPFLLNAAVPIDLAMWQLYGRLSNISNFPELVPKPYKECLTPGNDKVAIMYTVGYQDDSTHILTALDAGYFIFKVKIGHPGSQEEMLTADKNRLTELYRVVSASYPNVKFILDANGRYASRELLEDFIAYIRSIGALPSILFIEEPFSSLSIPVHGLEIAVGADESAFDPESTQRAITAGYGVVVLKAVARSMSNTLKILKVAHDNRIPCVLGDLTAGPELLQWQVMLASFIPPFPDIGLPLLEANGMQNYRHWEKMSEEIPENIRFTQTPFRGCFTMPENFGHLF